MEIIGTIALVLLLFAPSLYLAVNRWLAKRRMREVREDASAPEPAAAAAAAAEGADSRAPAIERASAAFYPPFARRETAAGTQRTAWLEAAVPAPSAWKASAAPRRSAASRLRRIEKLPPLKRAVVWSELLKPPPGIDPP